MTDANHVDPERMGSEDSEPIGPRVTDKRRLDPDTGELRHAQSATGGGPQEGISSPEANTSSAEANAASAEANTVSAQANAATQGASSAGAPGFVESERVPGVAEGDEVHPDTTLAADLTRDLQRLQAEYVNYKKRVDRDREMHRDLAVCSVIETLLPVLDDVHLARQHGDLEGGPFAAIADKLDATLTKIGVERFGQPGEAFDPTVHEALMHVEAELAVGTEVPTVVQVLQPGYRLGQRMIRPARVAVADPQPTRPAAQQP